MHQTLRGDERGLSFVEYLIVLCVVALLGFGAWRGFGSTLSGEVGQASGDVRIISASSTSSGVAVTAGPGATGGGASTAESRSGSGAGPNGAPNTVAPTSGALEVGLPERPSDAPLMPADEMGVMARVGAAMDAAWDHKSEEFDITGTGLGRFVGALVHNPQGVAEKVYNVVTHPGDLAAATWSGLVGAYDDAVAHTSETIEACVDGSPETCWRNMGVAVAATVGRPLRGAGAAADGLTPDAGDVTRRADGDGAIGGYPLPDQLDGTITAYARHSSSRELRPGSVEPGEYVYVQDVHGTVFIADNGPGMHPQTLGGGQPALSAGTVKVDADGRITEITNQSGHFQFTDQVLPGAREAMERQGMDVVDGPDLYKRVDVDDWMPDRTPSTPTQDLPPLDFDGNAGSSARAPSSTTPKGAPGDPNDPSTWSLVDDD